MTSQGRRGGSRRAASTESGTPASPHGSPHADPAPEAVPAPAAGDSGAQLLDDVSTRLAPSRFGNSMARSIPGAVVGTLLVVGLAFGAALAPTASRDGSTAARDTSAAGHGGENAWHGEGSYEGAGDGDKGDRDDDAVDPTDHDGDADGATDTSGDDGATEQPGTEPTDKPDEPDHTPKPTEKPDPTKAPVETISLALVLKESRPLLEWGSCASLDFDYYKVVRSTDSTVAWPLGDGDELIAVVEPGGNRRAWDDGAPGGRKAWYRVFCVRATEDGYKVLKSSATKSIKVPEAPTPPDPIALDVDWSINGEGKVVLDWQACNVEGFAFYKVLRSTSNDHPSYLPWSDGTQVIGVVENVSATEWHDWAPDAGHTAWYRVQCIGYVGDVKVLLGQTAVVTVTTPEP